MSKSYRNRYRQLNIMNSLFSINKPRLCVALYAFDEFLGENNPQHPQEYHWAVIIAPKQEGPSALGKRWLMRRNETDETPPRPKWEMIQGEVPLTPHHNVLVRVMIGKVKDPRRLADIIDEAEEAVDSYSSLHQTTQRTWIKTVIESLRADVKLNKGRCCNHVPEWENVEQTCVNYVQRKFAQGRFNDRRENTEWNVNKIPTLDMIHRFKGTGDKEGRVQLEVMT